MLVTTWSAQNKRYEVVEVTPEGVATTMVMHIEGKKWCISGERHIGEHLMRCWTKIEYTSNTEYIFRCECSADKGLKWLFSEGTSRKIE